MPTQCGLRKVDGTTCKNAVALGKIQVKCRPFTKDNSTCNACIPDLWKNEIVKQSDSTLATVTNTKHVEDIVDLSGHQDVLARIEVLLEGNDVEENVIADALLEFLQTKVWQFDLKKPKTYPYVLYLRRKLSLSLEDTVAALVMLKRCHQESKDKKKADQKNRRSSGDSVDMCNGCPGMGRYHTATFSALRLSFKCATCTNELLKQLSETNPSLYYISEIGEGIFLYRNPLYDASSIHPFCRVETFIYDLNHRLVPVVFMLLAAGVNVPSISDTVESKEKFVAMVNQMETEHEEYKRTKRQLYSEKADTLSKEQAMLAKANNDALSRTPQQIEQAVETFGQILDGRLKWATPRDPLLVMCNASSQELKVTTEGVIKGKPLSEGEHFKVVSSADEFDLASTDGMFPMPVLVYKIIEAVDHPIVRMAEEKGIKLIQGKTGHFISSEDTVYHAGDSSRKFAGGAATSVIIKGWIPLVQRGKISVNANLPQFMKENLMRIMSDLKHLRFWRLVGDRVTFEERMRQMNAFGSISSVDTSQQEQISAMMIMAQKTRRQERESNRKRQSLQDLDVNALKDDEDTDGGKKKQKAIPQEFVGKKQMVVSGSIGDRVAIQAQLNANASRLDLKMRADFPREFQAREYIFVSGEGATKRKVKTAKEHGVDTWAPGKLAKALAKL
ncbi:hypothetical protein ACHAWC_006200 [Mediolabrus comicus]